MCVCVKLSSNENGYKCAVEYVVNPILNAAKSTSGMIVGNNSQEFKFRLGTFLTNEFVCSMEETMVMDLIRHDPVKIQTGLQNLIDVAVKKYYNSNIVPQIEGLIAIYLMLLEFDIENKHVSSSINKIISSGSHAVESKASFIFSNAIIDAVSTSKVVRTVLHKVISIYVRMSDSSNDLVCLDETGRPSVAANAISRCITDSNITSNACEETADVMRSVNIISDYSTTARFVIIAALFEHINDLFRQHSQDKQTEILSREVRESIHPIPEISSASKKRKININFVRKISLCLLSGAKEGNIVNISQGLILSHIETTKKNGSSQRSALQKCLSRVVLDELIPVLMSDESDCRLCFVEKIVSYASSYSIKRNVLKETVLSDSIHNAALSLITTFGVIGGNHDPEFSDDEEDFKLYEFCWKLCVDDLAPLLSDRLGNVLKKIECLSPDDVDLFTSRAGVPYKKMDASLKIEKEVKNKKGYDEEEWEKQVKQEIAAKKSETGTSTLSAEDTELLRKQAEIRSEISSIVDVDYARCLSSIQVLCQSDIEIGNMVLPVFKGQIIKTLTSTCDLFNEQYSRRGLAFSTLCNLASCVYEIDDANSVILAHALSICYRKKGLDLDARYIALPSPCPPVTFTFSKIDEYGDCLSESSFTFLFPIFRAALTGQRTVSGCEKALKILQLHTELIANNGWVAKLRKDMAAIILELLCHDRAISFRDPTPAETLQSIYDFESLAVTSSELSPLLGAFGALGGDSCRLNSMIVLNHILSHNQKFLRINPLVENRIWLNCFAENCNIRLAARKAWETANGRMYEENNCLSAPSKMFVVALLPQLGHENKDISRAASGAFAAAMAANSDTIDKALIKLFLCYIDSYPTSFEEEESAAPIPQATSVAKKVKAKKSTVTKKKKSTGGVSAMATLTTRRKTVSKKSKKTSLGPKPTEREVDRNFLNAQFESTTSKTAKAAEKDSPQKVLVRSGIISVIIAMSQKSCEIRLNSNQLQILVGFLLAYGLADGNEMVRASARNALRDVVANCGADEGALDFLMPLLEASLTSGGANKSILGDLPVEKMLTTTISSNFRKEGVVIALGSSAIHLNDLTDSEKISDIIDMLISTLSTPSESVQSSVALCLSKLMKKGSTQERVESLLENLMKECLHGKSLASRRGSAYGISAVVKGSGIASLKKFEVIKQLEEALSTGPATKEGALIAIELLSKRLGLLFEPYVIAIIPFILTSFSDSSVAVRSAATSSINLIMSKLSAHGVKLLMPSVLSGLDECDWRTKQASIHMLGSMSHCAPKQLASCLPKVVPKLTEAFSDTHPKVKKASEDALLSIKEVIRNPEISMISDTLLYALTDPSNGTLKALESLIQTEFLHLLDAPSLALIVPVLHRGLRDRAALSKRYAALIAGNICTMINDPKDFVPYIPTLLPDLKLVLVDPIPDCRSTSAKALGSLTRSLGDAMSELRPWLIDLLKSEQGSSVERSGAAQGLSEVLCAGGAGLVDTVMRDEIIPLINHPKASTKEGVLWLLTFLPSSLGQSFAPLIDSSFPALISGLSDEAESVRDVALRAGRVMIRSHAKAHVDKFLPSLETSLSDEDYKIRLASLNLLGDLLSTLGGTKVSKGEADLQEDIRQAERAQAQIALALEHQTRKRILSGLYLRRSDSVSAVRQSAVQVWKAIVCQTPRALREILDVLVEQIVDALASGDEENTEVAGNCLGDITTKLGDSVIQEIIPILRDSLYRGNAQIRLGACVGLKEVIEGAGKEQITKYLDIIVKAVKDALCDESEGVRKKAASCFQSLYSVVGTTALDEVVPVLLAAMATAQDENARTCAINGLTGIIRIRSREVLPFLVPRLLQKPITRTQASALGSICEVSGESIRFYFSSIVPSILSELILFYQRDLDTDKTLQEESLRGCFRCLCRGLDENGSQPLVSEIASRCSSDKESIRKESCWMFQAFIEERKDIADFYENMPIMFRELLHRMNDESTDVMKVATSALFACTKYVPAEELVDHISYIRNLISSMVSDARRRKGGVGDGEFLLPGFNMKPKGGLEPLLPIYQRGILYGDAVIREESSAGLGELITITSSKYLAGPFIIKITGPLLRIVGDRNPSNVKIAIVRTLGLILSKGGPALRAFVPQFQTTFMKSLSDPSRQVRVEAINALGLLMPLSVRLDPLMKELVSCSQGRGSALSIESAGMVAVQTANLEALATILKHGGKKAKLPESVPLALDAGKELIGHLDKGVRESAGKVIGEACKLLGFDAANEVIDELIENFERTSSDEEKHGLFCAYRHILILCKEFDENVLKRTTRIVKESMDSENVRLVRESACICSGAILGITGDYNMNFEMEILKCMDEKDVDILRSIGKGLIISTRMKPDIFGGKKGVPILDAALKNAMDGNQRVQLIYNDFLWLALRVGVDDTGLQNYANQTMFENAKKMKSLYTKVLLRIKQVDE